MTTYKIKQTDSGYRIVRTRTTWFGKYKRYWGVWRTLVPESRHIYTVCGWTRSKVRAVDYKNQEEALAKLHSLRNIVPSEI
jgi:hypothetical protein